MFSSKNEYAVQIRMAYASELDKAGTIYFLEKRPNSYYIEIGTVSAMEMINCFMTRDNILRDIFKEYYAVIIDKFCFDLNLLVSSRLDKTYSISLDEIRAFYSIVALNASFSGYETFSRKINVNGEDILVPAMGGKNLLDRLTYLERLAIFDCLNREDYKTLTDSTLDLLALETL
jgi:hypothetical protein